MAVDKVGVDVPIKFDDSRSNGFSRYTRSWFRVEWTNIAEAYPNSAKPKAFRLKTVQCVNKKEREDGENGLIVTPAPECVVNPQTLTTGGGG